MQELKRGQQLASRYTLVRRLGAGGGAETWLATDRLSRASVAAKIQNDDSLDAGLLRREWQTSIRLVHAHIARAFEFHGDGERPFYTMQFVDGPDISVLAGAPPAEILPVIALICDALRFAHEKAVVHRDIKASNILLDGNGAPYLIDFGVAANAEGSVGGGSLIAASPQSLDGEAPQPADDLFALGGLLYELLRGRSPYSSATTAEDIRQRVPDPVTAPDGSPLPAAIVELVAGMLAKSTAERPDAAGVIATLADAGITPGPAKAAYVGGVRAIADEVIAQSEHKPVIDRTSAGEAARIEQDDGGIQPRTVGIALAVAALLLLVVVFVLPRALDGTDDDPEPVADTATEPVAGEVPDEGPADSVPQRDDRVEARLETERVLGRLLSRMRTLEGRAVQRWGGVPYRQATAAYEAGDAAYLERDYDVAQANYNEAFELLGPLLDQVNEVFERTLADAERALDDGDTIESLRLYELAVAISPSHGPAIAGLARAKNLDEVLTLTEEGLEFERNLELDAALANFERAIELDPQWEVAKTGLARVQETIRQMEFDQRMTEGLVALQSQDFLAARAAFRMAQQLRPSSPEPADGLLQVDQGIRLSSISTIEGQAMSLERQEQWQAAADAYREILELDSDLTFAQQGLTRANSMTALHEQINEYIANPDSLSSQRTMQTATQLVVDITRMEAAGPRLTGQRDELSRLLKRAATPLTVELISDNLTDVSIYKVGKLGTFAATQLSLRPGTYVAVGSRPGFRDVRLEFRVAPEIEMQPVVVRCEERI